MTKPHQKNYSAPPITVLMPVYNERVDFLEKSITSILDQTFSDFEFLIIDDCSTDTNCTRNLARYGKIDSRIRIIRNEQNLGLTKTLNKGLAMARGTYVARLDSDDIAAKNRLEKQLAFMRDHPDHVLVGSWSYVIDEYNHVVGKKQFYTDYADIRKHILEFNFFTHSTWFFKKDVIVGMGKYSDNAPANEDYDLLLRLISKHPVHNLDEFLCWYRLRGASISHKNNKLQERNSIATRIRAIKKYGYPKRAYWNVAFSILVYLLVPYSLKKNLLRLWERD